MLTKVKSYALNGLKGYAVDIEIDCKDGIPSFDIVGLPGNTVKEAKDRIRSAILNTSFEFSRKRITVNLAPADIKKDGSGFDLPLAIGFLATTDQMTSNKIAEYIIVGELSLDGSVRRINGIMPMLINALQEGYTKFIIPYDNRQEASFIKDIEVICVESLCQAVGFFGGLTNIKPIETALYISHFCSDKFGVDISDIKGQSMAKRAIEIAVAGGHNILLSGPPGTGKTMLAKCVPTIMPPMSFEEAIEVTKIHSVAGVLNSSEGILMERPFRSPHHTASIASLTGGGSKAMPGEVSLAHNGVLFLDEMPEYPRKLLETLRQPLEDGVIIVARVANTVEYPARFMMISSMNPCPCGNLGSKTHKCVCSEFEINKYKNKISAPLLDRIDLNIIVDNIEYSDLREKPIGENSETVRNRIILARNIQLNRFKNDKIFTNSQMNSRLIEKFCQLDASTELALGKAFSVYKLSARGVSRILKTARTISDLKGEENISLNSLMEAVQFRGIEKAKV